MPANRSTHGSASVDTVIWTFKTSLGEVLGEFGTPSDADTVTFPFLKAAVNRLLVDVYRPARTGSRDGHWPSARSPLGAYPPSWTSAFGVSSFPFMESMSARLS